MSFQYLLCVFFERIPVPLQGADPVTRIPGASSSVKLDSGGLGFDHDVDSESRPTDSINQTIFTLSELTFMELAQKQAWTRKKTCDVIRVIQSELFVREDLPADLYYSQ